MGQLRGELGRLVHGKAVARHLEVGAQDAIHLLRTRSPQRS
jgi:hypothetical protein